MLYDLQIVHGADYLARSTKRNAQTETVEAVRGQILDTNGRVLVSNRATYQVRLDTAVMGEEAQRNGILLDLLSICREQGVAWTDTMPVSDGAPYTYTLDTATGSERSAFLKLMKAFGANSSQWRTAAAGGVSLANAWESYRAAEKAREEGKDPGALPEIPGGETVSAAPLIAQMKKLFRAGPQSLRRGGPGPSGRALRGEPAQQGGLQQRVYLRRGCGYPLHHRRERGGAQGREDRGHHHPLLRDLLCRPYPGPGGSHFWRGVECGRLPV